MYKIILPVTLGVLLSLGGCKPEDTVVVCEYSKRNILSRIELTASDDRIISADHTISLTNDKSSAISMDQFDYLADSVQIIFKPESIDFIDHLVIDDHYSLKKTMEMLRENGYVCYN